MSGQIDLERTRRDFLNASGEPITHSGTANRKATMSAQFTGAQGATEILKVVLDAFSNPHAEIVYEGGIAFLRIQSNLPTDFLCTYRIDRFLLPVYSQCELLFDHYAKEGLVAIPDREYLVGILTYTAMSTLLDRFVLFHVQMFEEATYETHFLTESIFLQGFTKVHIKPENKDKVSKTLSLSVRKKLDSVIETIGKKRREFLGGFLNRLALLTIPVSVGRPPGSKKPDDKKRQESAEFEARIEQAIRSLKTSEGKMPTQIRVAKELGIGGEDSGNSAFYNKLKRDKIDYAAIAARVKLDE